MILAFVMAGLATQAASPPPMKHVWPTKLAKHVTAEIACKPNGRFYVSIDWNIKTGVEAISIESGRTKVSSEQVSKLQNALSNITEIRFIDLDCSGSDEGSVRVFFTRKDTTGFASMMIPVMIGKTEIDVYPAKKVMD